MLHISKKIPIHYTTKNKPELERKSLNTHPELLKMVKYLTLKFPHSHAKKYLYSHAVTFE